MAEFRTEHEPIGFEQVDSLVDLLSRRASRQSEQLSHTFLTDTNAAEVRLTYGQLHEQARLTARWLLDRVSPGDRVLLLYPAGPEFLTVFLGCMYAGVISIPMYPPRPNRHLTRLTALIEDSGTRLALTPWPKLAEVRRSLKELADAGLRIDAPDTLDTLSGSGAEVLRRPAPDDVAYLQYTSGSTSTPKGVMVSHGNLVYNCGYMLKAWGLGPQDVSVTWLPHFHDMGLIEGLLNPLFGGYQAFVLSPTQFVQRPLTWLETISKHRATHSGAPNFAWDLCVDKIKPEQRDRLDLASWTCAYNGAEPVRAGTLQRFAEYFAPSGFRADALSPCYGLAESTLMVSGRRRMTPHRTLHLDPTALESDLVRRAAPDDKYRSLVGCGWLHSETEVAIVDPTTLEQLSADRVGEIWVKGPTGAKGYWGRAGDTEQTFEAFTSEGRGPFLRTGDLGFLDDGELYIAGRLKDLIIIRGANFYPQDLERIAEASHPWLRPGRVAAFSVPHEGQEALVIAQEVDRAHRKSTPDEFAGIAAAIRQAVAEEFDIFVWCVRLLDVNEVHMTSSGKVQRQACKQDFLQSTGTTLWESRDDLNWKPASEPRLNGLDLERLVQMRPRERQRVLVPYLRSLVANVMQIQESDTAPDRPLGTMGLDSLRGSELATRIEGDLAIPISPTLVWNHPTILQISAYLADQLGTPINGKSVRSLEESKNHAPQPRTMLQTVSNPAMREGSGEHQD